MGQKLAVLLALLLVLSLPFIVRATSAARTRGVQVPPGTPKLVIITPHVEQIRDEFERAFDRWYFRTHNAHAAIDWRSPGGTSDIMKQLESTLEAAAKNGSIDDKGVAKPGTAGCDLFFGGGSYEHGKLKDQRKVKVSADKTISYRLSQPAGFTQKQLDDWFGENKIGTQNLYDPDQSWLGTALSGFGIVYNTDVLTRMGVPIPQSFEDLGNFRLFNMVALADGRQSGSVTTTYDAILNNMGWDKGWRVLREMSANARYFASSSTKPPIDVSQGDAAAGLAIDFYGRSQAQCLLQPGQDPSESRVGYADPKGAVYIDADPVTILNGAQNLDLARAFIEFCLTDEAQSLWQFPPIPSPASAGEDGRGLRGARPGEGSPIGARPTDPAGRPLGPDLYSLRRMPVRRAMYEQYSSLFVDKTNPFTIASDVKSRGWRSLIAPLMAAFGIDTSPELRAAWCALNECRALARESRFPAERLSEMEAAFYAMPVHTFRPGSLFALPESTNWMKPASQKALANNRIFTFAQLADAIPVAEAKKSIDLDMLKEWKQLLSKRSELEPRSQSVQVVLSPTSYPFVASDTRGWADLDHGKRSLISYTQFFKSQYRKVIDLAHSATAN